MRAPTAPWAARAPSPVTRATPRTAPAARDRMRGTRHGPAPRPGDRCGSAPARRTPPCRRDPPRAARTTPATPAGAALPVRRARTPATAACTTTRPRRAARRRGETAPTADHPAPARSIARRPPGPPASGTSPAFGGASSGARCRRISDERLPLIVDFDRSTPCGRRSSISPLRPPAVCCALYGGRHNTHPRRRRHRWKPHNLVRAKPT